MGFKLYYIIIISVRRRPLFALKAKTKALRNSWSCPARIQRLPMNFTI